MSETEIRTGFMPRTKLPDEFWVYDNWHRDHARVHKGDCQDCNLGHGKHPDASDLHGQWIKADSREDAFRRLAELGRADSRACAHCCP